MKYELIHLICLAEGFTLKNDGYSNNTIVNRNNNAAGDAIYPGNAHSSPESESHSVVSDPL